MSDGGFSDWGDPMNASGARRIGRGWLCAGALLALARPASADDLPRNLTELRAKDEAETEASQAKIAAASGDERQALLDAHWARIRATARQAFAYAAAHPDAPDSLDAIVWTVHGLANGYYPQYAGEITEAYRLLLARGLDSDKVAPVAYYAAGVANQAPEARRFLEAAAERSQSRLVRAAATLGLARDAEATARSARRIFDPIAGPELVERWSRTSPDFLDMLRTADPAEFDRRAEAGYERVIAEFADVRMPSPYRQDTFAEIGTGELYALRHLAIGRVAPEIEGEDVRGGTIKLSAHRGQVVALVFWATWCGPCMDEVPHERELVAKLAGRPFTLIGVDGDADRELARKTMAEQGMTWPSVWNGGNTGGVAADWGVRAWPTVYVLDARGVIRFTNMRGEQLGRAVEHLLKEVEAGMPANKPTHPSP